MIHDIDPALRRIHLDRLPDRLHALATITAAVHDAPDDADVLAELRHQAHQLRGSDASFGFPAVTELARAVETAPADGIAGAADALRDLLVDIITSEAPNA